MSAVMCNDPPLALRYDPSMETLEADEETVGRQLAHTLAKISAATLADEGRPLRSVHAKCHGVILGDLEVAEDLPHSLAQGLFSRPGRYPVVMRLSTLPGDLLDDSVTTPRGVGLKVIGVDGPRLPGSEREATQDFVLVNGPAFAAPNAKAFLANLKLLAATTDKAPGLKKGLSAAMRGLHSLAEHLVGKPSPVLATLGGQEETHILGDTFFSQVPILFGDYVAKIALVPASADLQALIQAPLDLRHRPHALREAVSSFFARSGGTWELKAQLCTDLKTMPIENAAVVWPEEQSPYLTVGRVSAGPQATWSPERAKTIDEGFSFSPWHGLRAHRPLGSINRVRRAAYAAGAAFRSEHGATPVSEPGSLSETLGPSVWGDERP
jgi:hypothetical protein